MAYRSEPGEMHTYRLRIEQPVQAVNGQDVAAAISNIGGSVLSVDLHEVEGHAAVDEIVVDLPGEIDQTALRSAFQGAANTALLSSKLCDRNEPVDQARRWAADTANDQPQPHEALAQRVADACPQAMVWLCDAHHADAVPAAQMAMEREAPVVHCATALPEQLVAAEVRSPRWVLAVPNESSHPSTLALLSRPMSLRFTATEVARVQLLLAS
jgi:hypothetical protein